MKTSRLASTRPLDWRYFFYPMPIFDPVMTGQRLNFDDLVLKIEVFQISEPIFAKVLKLATCDFHESAPWTVIYEMGCIWSICAVIITAYRLGSLKVTSAARHRLGWSAAARLGSSLLLVMLWKLSLGVRNGHDICRSCDIRWASLLILYALKYQFFFNPDRK